MQYHQSNTYVIRPDDNITSSLMKMEEQTYRKLNNTFNLITYFDINMKHAYSWEMRAPGHKPWRVCVSSRDEHYIVHNNLDARHNAHNHFTPVWSCWLYARLHAWSVRDKKIFALTRALVLARWGLSGTRFWGGCGRAGARALVGATSSLCIDQSPCMIA